jgi:hypothetical protein
LGGIPSLPVLHGKLATSGQAGYYLLFPGMVARLDKCSLHAQFPMKSVDTAANDSFGLGSRKTGDRRKRSSATVRCANGRRRTSCAVDATVAGAILR